MKNTGSQSFEGAYFVLRSDTAPLPSPQLMIDEANKIIEENFGSRTAKPQIRRGHILAFICGSLLTLAASVAVYFIVR
ncbi:MAG: hypothetical protein J6V09_04945 [Clostridia bacterium]|nr:hypothetical protein [Clostridia bacterium]